jgi:hypothetical protein
MSLIDIEAAAEPVDFDYFANPLVKKIIKEDGCLRIQKENE